MQEYNFNLVSLVHLIALHIHPVQKILMFRELTAKLGKLLNGENNTSFGYAKKLRNIPTLYVTK